MLVYTHMHTHTLNVSSTQPGATAEMSQRGGPLRMLLAVLFQSFWSCPFQLCPSSHATALGKEQQSLLWLLLHCRCHPWKREKMGIFLPFCLSYCQLLLDSVNQAEFWFVQLEFSSCRRHLVFTANKHCFHPWLIWVRDERINHHPSNILLACWISLVPFSILNHRPSSLD